jgi:hypothetical protein
MSRTLTRAALALTLATALAPAAAAAQQSDLERFEAAAEAMAGQMFDLLAQEQPMVADMLPDPAWDDAYREAGACVLARIRDETSPEAVERMLGRMEELAAAEYDSLAELRRANAGTAAGLPQERMAEINRDCGMQRVMMERFSQ